MELTVLSTGILEPVSVADVKDFMGYTASDQDAAIQKMITAAREWLENRCSLALISKSYKAYFTKADALNGWYHLPVSPVTEITTVEVCGVEASYDSLGMYQKKIKPYNVYGTIGVGSTTYLYYVEVTFTAGASNNTANEIIKYIVDTMFNNRDSGDSAVPIGKLPYHVQRLIESVDANTGL